MKKLALAVASVAIAATSATTNAAAVYSTWGTPYDDFYAGKTWNMHWDSATKQLTQSTNEKQAAEWMADLPDNMLVAHVSIPGAHDFATGEDNWASDTYSSSGPSSSVTQATTMREQMDRGIRGVDFRPGLHDNELYCNHGIARTTKKLETAVADIITFLQNHPKEFFVMHLFRGNVYNSSSETGPGRLVSDADRAQYNSELKRIFETVYGDYVVPFKPNLTVKEARGKIVIFTRDRISFVHLDNQARITNWDTNFANNLNPSYITNELNEKLQTKLHVQDISEGDDDVLATKQVHCRNLIDFAQAQKTPNEIMDANGFYCAEWVFNFTSIENSGSSLPTDNTNGYKGGASVMGPRMNEYIEQNLGRGPLGVFFSDYVLRTSTKKHGATSDYRYETAGDQLVYNIIRNNFTGGENAPVVRYAINESKDWDKIPENPYEGQKYFLMNVGATEASVMKQYFTAGGAWGGHAVVDNTGYPIELTLIGSGENSGRFSIKNPLGHLEAKESYEHYYADGTEGNTGFKITKGSYDGREVLYFTDAHGNGRRMKAFHETDKQFSDQATFKVEPEANSNDLDPYQMWVLIPYNERETETSSSAKGDHKMDVSYLIPNYTMSRPDTEGDVKSNNYYWKVTKGNKVAGIFYDRANFEVAKEYNANFVKVWNLAKSRDNWGWNYGAGDGTTTKWSVTTTIPSLPAGKYVLHFQMVMSNQSGTLDISGAASGSHTLWQTNENEASTSGVSGINDSGTNSNDDLRRYFIAGYGRSDLGNYDIQFEVSTKGDVNLNFHRDDSKTSATSFALANVRLYYLGNGSNTAEQTVSIKFPNRWNTMILPFDVANENIPDNLHIFKATGHTTPTEPAKTPEGSAYYYHLISYGQEAITDGIKANTPYLVYNDNGVYPLESDPNYQKAPARAANAEGTADETVYTFTGVPTNYHNTYHVYDTSTQASDFYLTGAINGHPVTDSHYALTNTGTQLYFAKNNDEDATMIDPNRCYVNSFHTNAVHNGIYFDAQNVLTGVETVAAEVADEDAPVDVYSIGGVLLRSQVEKADALTDLPRGIYILRNATKTVKVAK